MIPFFRNYIIIPTDISCYRSNDAAAGTAATAATAAAVAAVGGNLQ